MIFNSLVEPSIVHETASLRCGESHIFPNKLNNYVTFAIIIIVGDF